MKIRMTKTVRGAADGVTVITYEAGKEYELGETPRALDLALALMAEGWAEELQARGAVAESLGDREPTQASKPATEGKRKGK